jgi:hypothetical protein
MKTPINQKCPNCSHTFKTRWGLTSSDIDKMRQDAFDVKEETFLKDLIAQRKNISPKRNIFSFLKFWK